MEELLLEQVIIKASFDKEDGTMFVFYFLFYFINTPCDFSSVEI